MCVCVFFFSGFVLSLTASSQNIKKCDRFVNKLKVYMYQFVNRDYYSSLSDLTKEKMLINQSVSSTTENNNIALL